MVDIVKSGHLPLWNPYMFCGHPLLATLQIGFLYPLSLIHYLLPFHIAFNYYTIIHYFLGALFMYWLMRHYLLSRPAALLSAIVFTFSGYLVSMANMNTTLTSVIWLPLILLIYDKYINSFSIKYILILSILFVLQFLGGEPTIIYLSTVFLAAYGLIAGKSIRTAFWNVGGLVFSLVLMAGIGALQIAPFAEAVFMSTRSTRTDYAFISYKAFPPKELLNFLFPFFFGNLIKGATYTRALLGDQYQAWLISPYIGFLPLFFALLTWLKPRRRIILLWGIVCFSLFMAFGRYTPIFGVFFRILPGISLVRYPVKYIFLAVFSISLLCGFGLEMLQQLIENNKERLRKIIYFLGAVFVAVGLVYLWAKANETNIFLYFRSFYPSGLDPFYVGNLWKVIHFNLGSLNNLIIILFFVLLFFYFIRKGSFTREIFNFLIISVILLDLAVANIGINPPGDYRIFKESTPNLRVLQDDKDIFRYFAIPAMGKEKSRVFRIYNENLFNIKDNLTPNWLLPYKLADMGGRESMEPKSFTDLSWIYIKERKGNFSELLNMANVKYVFALRYINDPNLQVIRTKRIGDVRGYLYKNLGCLPRAYFVRSARALDDRRNIAEEIKEKRFNPRKEVLLEEEIDYVWEPAGGKETVKVIENTENKTVIKTFSDKSRVLFLSDTFYPGWRAFVDGKETKIYRANYMFRAIYLEPGDHKVKFVYDPFSLKLGAGISLFTILLLGFIFFRLKK